MFLNRISDVVAEHANDGDDDYNELLKTNSVNLAGQSEVLSWIECKLLRGGEFQFVIIAFRKQTLELFCAICRKLRSPRRRVKNLFKSKVSRPIDLFLPSFKLNILRRSRIFAARLCAIDAIRRLVFFVAADVEGFEEEFDGVSAVRGDESRWDTKLPTWLLGQMAENHQVFPLFFL